MRQKVIELRAKGLKMREIAATLGISIHAVNWHLSLKRRQYKSKLKNIRRLKRVDMFRKERGSKCEQCGYNKCQSALHFHHIDPSQKKFNIATKAATLNLETLVTEIAKCRLLCANCHIELTFPD
jgi:predicted transcriptional regulator